MSSLSSFARICLTSSPKIFVRMSSSQALTYTQRPSPSKSHLHAQLSEHLFPKGYLLTGVHAGVKKSASLPDLGVILSTSPAPTTAAACFTRNAFRAAPVLVSEDVLATNNGKARAVVVNSGCANAVTGKKGLEDAWAMARSTDRLLPPPADSANSPSADVATSETLVMSTGVIGALLPIAKILSSLDKLKEGEDLGNTWAHWERAARAFMTTDTFPKLRARTFKVTIDGQEREFRMAGMDKGAGMIHPDMVPAGSAYNAKAPGKKELHATLLGLIVTDAPVASSSLQSALAYAVGRSFNSISVDGDMSTNDTIIVLANGAGALTSSASAIHSTPSATGPGLQEESGRDGSTIGTRSTDFEIDETHTPEAYLQFRDILTSFAAELAQLVVRDGEGATKFVTVSVEGATTHADAHSVASRVSTSALVKTALYGEDANWGRILAATGSLSNLSAPLDPTLVSVSFIPTDGSEPLPLLVNGEPQRVDEVRAKAILEHEDLEILVDLGIGQESAKYWTCDFSYEYVRINGDYRS